MKTPKCVMRHMIQGKKKDKAVEREGKEYNVKLNEYS